MQKKENTRFRNYLIDISYMVIGCLITAAGLIMFTIPNHIAPGGSSGLATSLNAWIPVSVGILTWIVNVPILLASMKILGMKSGIKTLCAATTLSFFMEVISPFLPTFTEDRLMAAALGGLMIGVGIGIVFLRGISMGGTDQLSVILGRLFPNVSTGYILMICDGIVVIIAAFTFKELEVFLYSIICVFVASKTIDVIMAGMNRAKVFYIITEHGEEIAGRLNKENDNGCTIIETKGAFTGEKRYLLMTVVHSNTAMQTLAVVNSVDQNAFTFMTSAAEVHGKGFLYYRPDGNE